MRRAFGFAPIAVLLIASLAPLAAAQAPPGTRTLYLIRHGFYDSADSADARVGKHLTELGREQAKLAGLRLRSLPVKQWSVVSSTLTRAMESGDIIGQVLDVPVTRDSLISECTPASSRTDIKYDSPNEAAECGAQLEAAWARYAHSSASGDEHLVLACHGNVIRWFVTKALGVDVKQWGSMEIANGSITLITIKPSGAVRLVAYGDMGHIPLDKLTWAGAGPGWKVAAPGPMK